MSSSTQPTGSTSSTTDPTKTPLRLLQTGGTAPILIGEETQKPNTTQIRRPRVYVAGPYSADSEGAVQANISRAIVYADSLLKDGFAPFVPHLNDRWDTEHPHEYETWIELDMDWLRAADVMFVVGISSGVEREIAFAKSHDIPIFHSQSAIAHWKRETWPRQTGKTVWKDETSHGDPRFHAVLHELGLLHDKKQQDYGSDSDPFKNIRNTEEWGIPAWVGALLRGGDKIKRLQSYFDNGVLANEGARDAFMDLAVYAIIGLVLWEESQSGKPGV